MHKLTNASLCKTGKELIYSTEPVGSQPLLRLPIFYIQMAGQAGLLFPRQEVQVELCKLA